MLAADGAEAVELVAGDGEFDWVLMDLEMPVMDGLSASKVNRQVEFEPTRPGRRVPIVVCTTATILDGVEDLQQLGLDKVLAKPLSIAGLLLSGGGRLPGSVRGS